MPNEYDLVIIGAGLAGMTGGMYAARYGLSTGLMERLMGGAQIINVEKIENFPGFPQGISGAELAPAVQEQAMDTGVEFIVQVQQRVLDRRGLFFQHVQTGGGYLAIL